MPKSRRELGARQVRHDPLRRGAPVVSELKAEVVPVLAKLPTGPGTVTPAGEQVWALASISTLLEDEQGTRNRRLLLSKNIVGRVLFALESSTDLEVRREASGALRNLCIDGDTDLLGEVANKGGLEIVLSCLRWATMGLQNQERQLERARAPAREARERLLSKPVEQMNRKERRHAAKLQAGMLPDVAPHAEFAPDASAAVDVHGFAADAPQSLAAMAPAAAVCLVELCESLVTIVGCVCEGSEKLLTRAVRWDWHRSALDDHEAPRSAYAGEALAAWLCEAVVLGATPKGPCAAALRRLGVASANTLCALCDDASYGLAHALVGLPRALPTSQKGRRRAHDAAPLPTPAEMRARRAAGSVRLARLAQAVALMPRGDGAEVDDLASTPEQAARSAPLAVLTSGALCNVLRAVHAEALEKPVEVADYGPLGQYTTDDVLPRLVHLLSTVDVDTLVTQNATDVLETCELALEAVAELMSLLGRGDEQVEQLSITQLPLDSDEETEEDIEALAMSEDDSAPEDEGMASDADAAPAAPVPAAPHALDDWVFARLLHAPLLNVLLRLAAPSHAANMDDAGGAARRAVALRALAAANNFLLRLALFAPPPPSQWPSDEATLARVALWRAWVGTAFLDASPPPPAPTPAGRALEEVWTHVFAIAAHWAAVPSVVDAETGVGEERASARTGPAPASAAQDGLAMVDTCLGCLWSIARILEGQLPLVEAEAPAPYITALLAAYHSARHTDVRVKSLGTLAVLARAQTFRAAPAAQFADPVAVPQAYAQVYELLGRFFVESAHAACREAQVEVLVAALNAVMDTYANELAPWDVVYRKNHFQTQLAALVPRAMSVAKRVDRKAHAPLYAAAQESVQNLQAFLTYRDSVH